MSDLLFWAADHVALWTPFAIAVLAVCIYVIVWYAFAAWEANQ